MMELTPGNSNISTATITWQRPPDVSGSISYTVERMVRNSGQSFQGAENFESDDTMLSNTLTGLSPFTSYLVRVTASSGSVEHDVCTTIVTTAEGGEALNNNDSLNTTASPSVAINRVIGLIKN